MRIDFVTLFPETVLSAVRFSILKRAEENSLVAFGTANPRDFATDRHRTVDDEPYGGGPGMVMKAETTAAAIEAVVSRQPPVAGRQSFIIFPDPAGELFRQADAAELSRKDHLVFVCGHYEGIDERVVEKYADRRYSLGDYVLSGGELAAAVMADAVVRLLPGAVGAPESLEEDAFADGLLTYPQYTRPEVWEGRRAPEVLLSGDHARVADWRRRQRLLATRERRPDLFARADLSTGDLDLLK
ncbi:MAG: tRNA (guanosine(37)-N1)-methyltransferase TrmD [Armatimonadetes bacterium]|nr:tRNA (guanosine(37)-N1)-methyltransferase TrmD [Armatimonadota bacterium]